MQITYISKDSVDSTIDWAKRSNLDFAPNQLYAFSCKEQTKGQGRFGKTWHSPFGKNIYASYAFIESVVIVPTFAYAQAAALTVESLLKSYDIQAQIKWPNDLIVEKKKIAGILVSIFEHEKKRMIIISVGMNVNLDQTDLLHIDQKATSMQLETAQHYDVEEIYEKLTKSIALVIETLKKNGPVEIAKEWQKQTEWIVDDTRKIKTNTQTLTGKILSIETDGSIYVQQDRDNVIKINSCDIME